jgi:hypothetical protein
MSNGPTNYAVEISPRVHEILDEWNPMTCGASRVLSGEDRTRLESLIPDIVQLFPGHKTNLAGSWTRTRCCRNA